MPSPPVGEYIAALLASPRYGRQVTHHRTLPGREAEYGEVRRPWPGAISGILSARGIPALYSHQARAADALRAGRHVIAATPTASGKSLIYNLPILERFVLDPDARALMLFPLKALARDQMAAFDALTSHWPEAARPTAMLYDGDTPDAARRKIRKQPPSVLVTNPEMLHLALLPHHTQWTTLFASLTHVVVDEAHTYRGVLGAHMAQVFRRLGRICARYGTYPAFVLCSATVGNPGELAERLLGLGATVPDEERSAPAAPTVITESGAPSGARHMVFIDPEESPSTTAIALLQAALARNLRTIVYCRSRRMTELIALWAADKRGAAGGRISAYRAGFLPEERRDIEARLSSGELGAVITTSALELGIDIGSLDVCILVGYPGTVMATLQRGGRVGRSGQESAVLLVAGEDALDQYFIHNPDAFFAREAECAIVNPDNEVIVRRHLECAAAELPLRADEAWLRSPGGAAALTELSREGLLLQSGDGKEWLAARKRPQRNVDLRGSGSVHIIEDTEGTPIGSLDGVQAMREAHPGAVYLHRGKTYVITEFDAGSHRIRAEAQRVNWFTRTRSHKQTEILGVAATTVVRGAAAALGRLRVTETITGYERRSTSGNRLLAVNALDLPPLVFETEGLWLIIPDAARREAEDALLHFMGGIHALEHAMIGLMPLAVMADRNDFGGISIPMHPQLGAPAVFVYDGLPGGAGLCRAAFAGLEDLLCAVENTVSACSCTTGCPSCVHSPKCGSGNRPIAKDACLFLLDHILRPSAALTSQALRDEATSRTVAPTQQAPGQEAAPLQSPSPAPDGGQDAARRIMVLDVETRRSAAEVGGWHRADQMGVSVAVLYDSAEDAFITYEQEELDLPGGCFDRLRQADIVIGFNIIRFDYKVLQPFAGSALADLPTLDMLDTIKQRLSYRVSLDNLAQATLHAPKSADGLTALEWWKEGRIADIAEYCRKDVELTRDLYRYGCEHGYVLFTNKAGQVVRIPVDWA